MWYELDTIYIRKIMKQAEFGKQNSYDFYLVFIQVVRQSSNENFIDGIGDNSRNDTRYMSGLSFYQEIRVN